LVLLLSVTLTTPIVQTELAHYATEKINKQFNINASIKQVAVGLDGSVLLKNVKVLDDRKNVLANTERLHTNILDFQLLLYGQLYFGSTELENLDFHIRKYKGDTLTNLDKFIETFDDGQKGSGKFYMNIEHLKVTNGSFSIVDDNLPNAKSVDFTKMSGLVDHFVIKGPNISAQVKKLSLHDHRGLTVKDLAADFSMTKTSMDLKKLNLTTDKSVLVGSIEMRYNEGDLKHFVDKVNLNVKIDKSSIATDELRTFYKGFGSGNHLYLKTRATGTLNNFTLSNAVLADDIGSQIIGNFKLENLLDKTKEFKIITNLDRLFISRKNAVALLPNVLEKALPAELDKIGMLDLRGALMYTNFTVEADIQTVSELGLASAKVSMSALNNPKKALYRGDVILEDFNIGGLIDKPNIGTASLNLFIDGQGFDTKNLNTTVTGDVYHFDFNGYQYQDIIIDGKLKMPTYQGFVSSKDPNAILDFDGVIDFSSSVKEYNFKADITHLNLRALGFVKDSISEVKGLIELNAKGNTIDDFEGVVHISDVYYKSSKADFEFKDFEMTSTFSEDGTRMVEMNSPDIVEGYIRGKYKINQLKAIVENALGSLYTNYSPLKLETGQYLDFDFNINSKIVELFAPNIQISEDTRLQGSINADEGDFKLNFDTPFVNVSNNAIKNIAIQVDNKNPLFNTYISIDSIRLKGYDITDFNLLNVTHNDTLFVRTEFKGGKEATDSYDLNLYHTINKDNLSIVGFQKSEFKFKDYLWYINEDDDDKNRVVFNKKLTDFDVEHIEISHEEQTVLLSGVLRDSTYKDLKLTFEKVDLNKITPDIHNLSLGGLINGKIAFEQRNKVFRPSSSLEIDNLEVNDVFLGKFNFDVEGDESLRNFKVRSNIVNDFAESFYMNGNISVEKGRSNLDLDVGLVKFDLKAIAPFLSSIMSDVRGDASGRLTVSGIHTDPTVDGRIYLSNAGMRPVFTGVDYVFDENAPLDITEKQFILRNVNITDSKHKTKGLINGYIAHDRFQNWNLNVKLNSNNLLALDKAYQEGTPYYGVAYIDGYATIIGPAEALNIKIEATSKEGTSLKIPLNETGGVGDNNFIHFVTAEEKRNREKGVFTSVNPNQFGGVQLDFEFVITPDAEIEVLLDRESGHGMKGRGAGFITMGINTLGSFNMWGDFQVYEGVYNFKYSGLIDKKFQVKKYGTIRWDGDPMNALLDLQAIYHTQANPGTIVENSAINRKVDTDVSIILTGNLATPEIDFNIDFPNVSSSIKSEIDYKLADKDTRETQAMALLATGSFINSENASTAVYGSLFERASSLFDDLFSDEDGKFKVGLNYSQSDRNPYAENDAARVGVTLSTQVSDKILINGKLGVPVGGAEDNVIVGDVEVQLLLNEDGSLKARVFNRENDINYLGEGIGYTQGVGLTYEVDFETFKELLKRIFTNANKKAKEKATSNSTNEIPDDDFGSEFIKYQENRRKEKVEDKKAQPEG